MALRPTVTSKIYQRCKEATVYMAARLRIQQLYMLHAAGVPLWRSVRIWLCPPPVWKTLPNGASVRCSRGVARMHYMLRYETQWRRARLTIPLQPLTRVWWQEYYLGPDEEYYLGPDETVVKE